MENILDDLEWRGLIKDFSDKEAIRKMFDKPQTVYCGFDPSASSMHVGNFVMISLLMRFQQAGHRVIALAGGATGMIGDPSGKSKERNFLTPDQVLFNVKSIQNQLSRYLDFSDEKKGLLVNNYDWLSKISILDFLRDYGKYFPINYLLSKDIIASRLEAGISFTEFSYNILQAADFKHLFDTYNCHIQLGGSDQWGNLTSGLELLRKVYGSEVEAGAMTCHLITRSDGKKFGKSEQGAMFLDKNLTSPYTIYQYFINTTDEDAVKYLKVFTFLTRQEIEQVAEQHFASLGQRIAQKVLAYEVVKTIHSKEEADECKKMAEVLFSGDVSSLSKNQIEELFGSLTKEVDVDLPIEQLLVTIGAASSNREAREFVTGNSVLVNGTKVNTLGKVISKDDALYNEYTIIRRGKKNYFLVKHK